MVKNKKTKVTISIDDSVLQSLKVECEKYGMKVSPRINALIKASLKNRLLNEFE